MSDPKSAAKAAKQAHYVLAQAIIKAHHGIWPEDVDIQYRVIARRGKVKVEFSPPQEKETGWVDG